MIRLQQRRTDVPSNANEEANAFAGRRSVQRTETAGPRAEGEWTDRYPLLRLQQSGGNQAVQRLLNAGIRPKLNVGRLDDRYEREADRVAEAVGRQSRSDDRSEEGTGQGGLRVVSAAQRQGRGEATGHVPPVVDQVLRQSGRPLDDRTRESMEERLGHDFGDVRVHTGVNAAESARAIDARAYTVGRDVVFGAGRYAPATVEGRRLLAHELTHVRQQTPHGGIIQRQEGATQPGDVSARLEELIPETGRSRGPVPEETAAQAREYLSAVRTILSDVHRDMNTVLHIVREIQGLVSTDVFDSDLLLTILYEGLDAASIAVPEELEAVTTVVAKTIKVTVMTVVRHQRAEAANRATLTRLDDVEGLFQLLVEAQTAVDELRNRVSYEPALASALAAQPVPSVPRRVATGISRQIEVRLLATMLRAAGVQVETEETETVALPPGENYQETEMNRTAFERHEDPTDNFWLRRLYIRHGWSLPRFGPTGNTEYSWYYYTLTGANEEMIRTVLERLHRVGVPKSRLFELLLGSALQFR
jgi:hypothetical protein